MLDLQSQLKMTINTDAVALLEKNFDVAFAAPDGIKKLRELILSLAMQGKLVPQDEADRPASELLKEIAAEKSRLVKDGKIKASKPLPEIKPDEIPYDLPKSWEWVRLDDIVSKIGSGSTPRGGKESYLTEGIPFLRSQNIWNDGIKLDDVAFISEETHDKMSATTVMSMDILLNITGASIGRCAIVPDDFKESNVSQHVTIIRCVNPEIRRFIHFLLISPYGQSMIWSRQVGMSREGLSKKVLEQFQISLPPLAEQRRIVAKIDELMARCDELERLKAERDRKQITVHKAALNRLLTAKDHSDFQTSWHFITQHFSELYSVKENVAELRKAILQIAVMGKLVPQDPSDQPASELLKEIEKEKQKLIKEGKIKASKPLPEIKPDEFLYDLPKGWKFVRLGQLANEITTGPFGLMIHKSDYIENGVPLINPIHMVNGEIIHDPTVTVTSEKARQLESHRLFDGDIVMARRGELGRCAIVTKQSDQWLCGTGSFVLRLPLKISRSYILTLFKSQGVRDYLGGNSVGTTMTNLNHGILNKMLVMLPPVAEQHRIVAKIDRLMTLCDELEKQIDAAESKQTNLLNSMMEKV